MSGTSPTLYDVTLSPSQVAMLKAFQRAEGLPSETATLKLLLEIAFETVNGTGDRFWDKSATPGNGPPRRPG